MTSFVLKISRNEGWGICNILGCKILHSPHSIYVNEVHWLFKVACHENGWCIGSVGRCMGNTLLGEIYVSPEVITLVMSTMVMATNCSVY